VKNTNRCCFHLWQQLVLEDSKWPQQRMDLPRRLLMTLGFQTLDLLMDSSLLRSSRTKTWYQVHTKLHLDLKILLASQNLTKASHLTLFNQNLLVKNRNRLLLSIRPAAATSRFKMTSTFADVLGQLPHTTGTPLDTWQLGVSTLDLNVCWCPLAASTHFGNTSRYKAVGSLDSGGLVKQQTDCTWMRAWDRQTMHSLL
jgi:hypothetical protein